MRRLLPLVLVFAVRASIPLLAQQASSTEQVQVSPPTIQHVEPPPITATFEELDKSGDRLRAEKSYLDALDYYRAALKKKPDSALTYNKIGIVELQIQRYKEARKDFEKAIKADRNFSNAYNNLGAVYYEQKKYGSAIKQYEKALKLQPDIATFYCNMGAAYFAKKDFEKASVNYAKALELDPDVLERHSRTGVSAQLPTPEDRAKYAFVMAKLYAKSGSIDRSLEYLKRAMEEGYKDIGDVYKDSEFAGLRKDPRFTSLMESKPATIQE
ncbi:MAG TPA: tetratricopeptide repeat protein [Terriglobales bacterium]|jgi:tetratricopeptide (TPR) repeat protein